MSAYYILGANQLVDRVLSLPPHEEVFIDKHLIPHPVELGFEQSLGEPHGQIADFRAEVHDGRGLHIRDHVGRWSIHWDRVFPSMTRWVEHLREDSPIWYGVFVVGVIIAAVIVIFLLARWIGSLVGG
jgi:hypothetical protein